MEQSMHKLTGYYNIQIKKIVFLVFLFIALINQNNAQTNISILYPQKPMAFPEADEFASIVAGKAWDMKELYDITYRYGFFEPFTEPQNGVWTGITYSTTLPAYLVPLFRGIISTPGYLQYFGYFKPGTPYGPLNPIDASYYTRLSIKHYLPATQRTLLQINWYKTLLNTETNTILFWDGDFSKGTYSNTFVPYSGFKIYDVDMTGQDIQAERYPNFSGGILTYGTWEGTLYGLDFVPSINSRAGVSYKLDWIRLYHTSPETQLQLQWYFNYTGGGDSARVSLQLFVTTNASQEGYLFLSGITNDGSLLFHTGALPPGEYYLYLKAVYDTGSGFTEIGRSELTPPITINARPTFEFTSPSFTSGVDYATADRGNPWDMNDASDIDVERTINITSASITSGKLVAVNTSTDPQISLSLLNSQGVKVPINTKKYRYLTFKMFYDDSPYPSTAFSSIEQRDNDIGWVARLQWAYTYFEVDGSYTKDIILHQKWNDYTVDLWDNSLLETRGYDGPNAGWTNIPAANYFIFHPMEPSVPITFYLDYVKLCAENKPANNAFPIRWVCNDAENDPLTITLMYGNGRGATFSGTTIAVLTNQTNTTGEYIWNTTDVPYGSYTIRAIVFDGTNTLIRDSLVPVIVEGTPKLPTPTIEANGETNFVSISNGTPVTISIALDAGSYAGIDADWWAAAFDQNNTQWYYLDNSLSWLPFSGNFAECFPAYQGALFNLDYFAILQDYTLPVGVYTFYFAVDQMDGMLNYPAGPIVYSFVAINVEE